ncbi:type III-A CRISPR-associated protein Csm2 [Candidatus Micrarchaeota archaeon]|nr:type III-A CRISPR-associated protein Csm2 [Candidatus Micrarchaeota archaeon]
MKVDLWIDKTNGKIDPKLFSAKAEAMADELDAHSQGRKLNKRTQIRKFYDEVARLSVVANRSPEHWDSILPRVHMLIAKAAYAEGRGLVSPSFLEFIKHVINNIDDSRDLSLFADFFEATMGYYRKYGA